MNNKKIYLVLVISIIGVLVLLLGIFFGVKLYFKEEIAYYEQKCQEYAIESSSSEKGGVVFIGDSITEYYPLEEHYKYAYTHNRGIKNDMTLGVLNRLQTSVFDLEPSTLVIMVGASDINFIRSINSIVKTYKEIVYSAFDNMPTGDIYVMSVTPQNKDYEKNSSVNVDNNMKRIRELNAKLEAFCDTCSATYINLFDLLVDENGYLDKAYSDDGFHLNDAGYQIWTQLMKEYNIA